MPPPEKKRSHTRFAAGSVEATRIRLLGGFRVSVGPRVIEEAEWRSRKAAAVVKLLALSPGHRLHRGRITALLWPNLDSRAASNNLHRSLHAARRILGGERATSPRLRLDGELVSLCPDRPLRTDVEAFEEAAMSARRAREPGAYRAAIELYAGELLPEDRYEAWAEGFREELRNLCLALLVEMAELHEARGEHAPAIEALLRVVRGEPANEAAHVGLMRLYAASGRRREALGQYGKLESILAVELDARPDAETRRLHREIQAGRLPPARPAEQPPGDACSPRHNLPEARTSFVGREREMMEVRRLLSMSRLLTLTGPGGCGKTRLALEVARDLADAYPDGVWLVELAPMPEPDLVLQAVAGVLGAREHPERPLAETVCRRLKGKRTLLVLDNCEHLIEACAGIVDTLLSSCPGLRVLATSRESLGVSGEALWPVSPLSVPETELEDPRSCEAVRLFLDRARSRLPAFDLTPGNTRAVAEVCRRLDGIPLAIELAAARVAALAVEQVAERLSDSLNLLADGPRTADSRHRTLRATLDWSYDLLGDPERSLFERLPVFAGGWSLEAAEAVGTDTPAVPSLLASLVDKSLVVAEVEHGASRYRMLETVRQYAGEKLEEGGEAERVRQRHAGHYLALAERAEPEISGPRQVAWLERLETEHDNLRVALSWCLNDGEPPGRVEAGLRMAGALGRFWNAHGFAEGGEWLDKGLEGGGDVSSAVRAKALRESGRISLFRGQHKKAVERLEEGLELYRSLDDRDGVATTLANLGFIMVHAGHSERVATLREEAEALRREPLDRSSLAHLLTFLGLAALSEWDQDQATGPLEESLALSRELQDARGIVVSLTGLGMTALRQRDHERAAALFEENMGLLREQGDRVGIAYSLIGLAAVAASRRQPARAARLWGAAEALREAVGIPLSPFDRAHYEYERRISEARSTLDGEAWSAAWAEGRNTSPEQAIEYALGTGEPSPASPPEQPSVGETGGILSPREREVADLIARGFANRRIAAELSISERTVHNHVAKILRKLGFRSRTHIAAWVIEHPP